MSLLEKAKSIPAIECKTNPHSDIPEIEKIEVAIEWLKGLVTNKQIAFALGRKNSGGSLLYNIAYWLKLAYKKGYLKPLTSPRNKRIGAIK